MLFLERLEAVCRRQPDKTALTEGQRSLTYGQLWSRLSESTESGIVIVQGGRTIDFIVEFLSYWKTDGAIPLPLESQIPDSRREELRSLVIGAPIEGLAYAITTSGSSGNPKIVLMTEGGFVPMLEAQIEAFGLNSDSRCLWMLSPGFDASLSDIGAALLAGATLICGPDDTAQRLPQVLRKHHVTYLDMPTSLLEVYRSEDFPETLKTLVVGGAPSQPEVLRRWSERFELFVVYGPTEVTVCSSLSRVDRHWDQPYIGQPIGANEYRIVDSELQISGPALAAGYLCPEETANRFGWEEGKRWYSTGDRVTDTGNPHGFKFLGRLDRQVKIRGQRIELEEIERRLWPVFGAGRVAVLERDQQLEVFWEGDGSQTAAESRLAAELPAAWQPSRWQQLPQLPRTDSGKVCHLQLKSSEGLQGLDSLETIRRCLMLEREGLSLSGEELLGRETVAMTATELQAQTQALARGLRPGRASTGRALLVTGSSGRLGRALLPKLMDSFDLLLLERHSAVPEGVGKVIKGDVSLPGLGLSKSEFQALSANLGQVLNLAGRLDLGCSFHELLPVNAGALLHLSQLGAPIHHASTLAVCLARQSPPSILSAQSQLPTCSGLVYGGYAQSKWVADQLFHRLPRRGWNFRYGQLFGAPQADELLYQTIQGLRDLGCYPAPESSELSFDFTPLEWAAEATAVWLERTRRGNRNLHLSCNYRVPITELFALIPDLTPVTAKEFFALAPHSDAAAIAQRSLNRCNPEARGLWQDFDLLLTSGIKSLDPVPTKPRSVAQLSAALADYVRETLAERRIPSSEGGA